MLRTNITHAKNYNCSAQYLQFILSVIAIVKLQFILSVIAIVKLQVVQTLN